jgi:hypothetical protein
MIVKELTKTGRRQVGRLAEDQILTVVPAVWMIV